MKKYKVVEIKETGEEVDVAGPYDESDLVVVEARVKRSNCECYVGNGESGSFYEFNEKDKYAIREIVE